MSETTTPTTTTRTRSPETQRAMRFAAADKSLKGLLAAIEKQRAKLAEREALLPAAEQERADALAALTGGK